MLAVAAFGIDCTAEPVGPAAPLERPAVSATYRERVAPVLEGRCAVCHGCYDAPCQLLLSSHAGADRGATKRAVYAPTRLLAAEPTRLGIDERSTTGWRQRGFFPVLEPSRSGDGALLLRMLALGRAQPFAPDSKLPEEFPMDIGRELTCPKPDEFDSYARHQPLGGMPYGMAPLSEAELRTLTQWVAEGAPPPPPAPIPARAAAQVERWEAFLNGESLKQRITARYLYEHWVFAHLYFGELPEGPFFRIVRSRTAPGAPVEEIASRRPYDDPGVDRVFYRLVPLDEAILHKTHIVYALDEDRLRRLTELFLESDWQPTRLPGYDRKQASNPFASFDQIPARSRYRFLLDDARYFVMTFIRGPVCYGQVAVDVIEDRFFVAFLDPEADPSVLYPDYLEETRDLLSLPAAHGSGWKPGELWLEYALKQRKYLEKRRAYYDRLDPERLGPTLDFLWDGDGWNRNAQLTVFRNFDNAMVELGFLGAIPETAWVMDFPIFERIYYDLVAGFDVFGNVTHQVSTRLYMDHLRMQSETLFLSFLPEDEREAIRASWYEGATEDLSYEVDRIRSEGHGTRIPFRREDPKAELIELLLERDAGLAGPPDLLNRCPAPPCDRPDASAVERRAERALQALAGLRGPWVAPLPELSLLRVRSAQGDALYTLLHDRAHTNVASMFGEEERLEPEKDVLTIARGVRGSYPNFLFEVQLESIETFVDELRRVADGESLQAFVDRFGVRRTSPRFWASFDRIQQELRRERPIEAGLLDLNRYRNL